MYTQCPECGVAFRVTAEVLKMAAGKVRCGGCGVAFNALAHLSEEKPAAPVHADQPPDPDLPELAPEEPGELEADTPPQTISAEQSAALLKTLDQLAGDDIRIEDTGVEWRVLDNGEPGAEESEPFEQASDEPSQVIDQMLFDDDTVLPDDFEEVVDAPQAPTPAGSQPQPLEPEPEAPQFDLELSEPDEWEDLLGDFDEPGNAEPADPEPEIEVVEEPDEDDIVEAGDAPPDMDTQFAIQAEAMGIDLSGMHDIEARETTIEEDLMAAAFETEDAVEPEPEAVDEDEFEPEVDDDVEIDLQLEEEEETEDDVDDIAHGFDDKVEEDIATLSMSLDEEDEDEAEAEVEVEVEVESESEAEESAATTGEEHIIPEMSEEEKTINMMIDEELLNIAVEDEEGFASTIVQLQPNSNIDDEIAGNEEKPGKKKKKDKEKKKQKKKDKDKKQPQVGFETIIMEGEAILGDFDRQHPADKKASSSEELISTGISISLNREKDDYAKRREMVSSPAGTGSYVGIAALVLLLVLQAIHQSREALATVPAFNSAVGPVYRLLGQPLTPTWNISGWRFEATKGDTDESGELLTIYSRIGNNSDEPLPYPLVHLSLTDRFEDVIGSNVLDPAEFLPENADPRKLVPPGNTFNAVISIDSPAENATGFKLNVCYRLASGQLRCADHDFK